MIIEYITRSFIEMFWIWTGNNPPCPIMACVLLILETTTVVHTCRKSWLDIYVCVHKIFSSSANLAVCILLMVIPKSLKLKYSSTKCRKSALKNKRITSTSESCTDSSQTNRSWFFTNAFVKLSPILLLLYCLQFVKKMKACELEIGFIGSARPRDVEQMERSQSFHHTLHGQLILFAERR